MNVCNRLGKRKFPGPLHQIFLDCFDGVISFCHHRCILFISFISVCGFNTTNVFRNELNQFFGIGHIFFRGHKRKQYAKLYRRVCGQFFCYGSHFIGERRYFHLSLNIDCPASLCMELLHGHIHRKHYGMQPPVKALRSSHYEGKLNTEKNWSPWKCFLRPDIECRFWCLSIPSGNGQGLDLWNIGCKSWPLQKPRCNHFCQYRRGTFDLLLTRYGYWCVFMETYHNSPHPLRITWSGWRRQGQDLILQY